MTESTYLEAISAGPYFKFNPSVSFIVNYDPSRMKDARRQLDAAWKKLSQGGTALMPLDKYPFSERFGWIQDKFGVSWQIVPTVLNEMWNSTDEKKVARVTASFLQMKKFDISALKRAYEG